jgi:Zn-dependent protease
MLGIRQGSIHLFRLAGVDLFLHWSWFVVAVIEIERQKGRYTSITWSALEYLALFLLVLLHEFGHALACRQVGGTADRIVLWPLGGVAYVHPPQRPGATLWSIAAGPLVNVALLPVLGVSVPGVPILFGWLLEWARSMPNTYTLIASISIINTGLLILNVLPIYPLDGGQILRSLLWFMMGRARSLMTATILGLLGIAGFLVLALKSHSFWSWAISGFMLLNCWDGLRHAQVLLRDEKVPRREGFACPNCHAAPLMGERWKCDQCGQPFDTFQTQAVCPKCAKRFPTTMCGDCGKFYPMNDWLVGAVASIGAGNSGLQEQ